MTDWRYSENEHACEMQIPFSRRPQDQPILDDKHLTRGGWWSQPEVTCVGPRLRLRVKRLIQQPANAKAAKYGEKLSEIKITIN